MKKSGGGGRNWGNDAAAGMDSAAAGAENGGDGPAGNWGANGGAPNAEVCCCSWFDFEGAPVLRLSWHAGRYCDDGAATRFIFLFGVRLRAMRLLVHMQDTFP